MVISNVDMCNANCIFCDISHNRIIGENDLCFAILDSFPVSEGHTLIIPKRHVADYFDLCSEEVMSMYALMKDLKLKLDADLSPDGYNVGININESAGQTRYHVHMHLIPRYKGDVENPRGGVRDVIPNKQKY